MARTTTAQLVNQKTGLQLNFQTDTSMSTSGGVVARRAGIRVPSHGGTQNSRDAFATNPVQRSENSFHLPNSGMSQHVPAAVATECCYIASETFFCDDALKVDSAREAVEKNMLTTFKI